MLYNIGVMAKINNYFKDKYDDDQAEFRSKISRHRRFIVYRILIILAIAGAVCGAMYYNYKNMIYTDYTVLRTMDYEESTTAKYLKFNKNILRYSTDGISAFNMDNEMLWNKTFEMQNPIVDVCNDYVAVGDYKGSKIYVLNSQGPQGEIDTTLPIQNLCVSGTGNVAVILEEGEVTWVKLFNKEGQNIANDRTTMDKSGYPVAIAISDDGIMLCVSYLIIDGGSLTSSVAYYNFGNVGQNEIDNLVAGYNFSNSIISYVNFMNANTSFAVGDNRFEIFKGAQKPENVFETEITDEIKSVFCNEDYIGLVYAEGRSENPYHIDVYNTAGEIVFAQDFALDYSDVVFNKDFVIIYNSDDCIIYNLKGVEKFNGTFRDSIVEMVPTDSITRYLLVSGTRTEEIQLK
ncbi:MAG: hypothetical protein IJT80_07340 [Lachnospiraceae bacterium]|nr:hypothetical protein [Lachnospiraceae bacterium]